MRRNSVSGHHIDVDVLREMKKGAPMLKYGAFGYPHFRLVCSALLARYLGVRLHHRSIS